MKLLRVGFLTLFAICYLHACSGITYELKKDGTACLIVETTATLNVAYFDTKGKQLLASWPLGDAQSVGGSCGSEIDDGSSSSINMTFPGYWLELQFANKSGQVSLAMVSLEVDTQAVRQFVSPNETTRVLTAKPDRSLSKATEYFVCNSALQLHFSEAPAGSFLGLASTKLQAFGLNNGSFSDKSAGCTEDLTSTAAPTTMPPVTTAATTAVVPTTSAPSTPPLVNFTWWDNSTGGPCLRLQLRATFAVLYQLKSGANATVSVPLPDDTRVITGSCGNTSQTIQLEFQGNWRAGVTFAKQDSGYSLSLLQLQYSLNPALFPNASSPGQNLTATGNQTYFTVTSGSGYYSCSAAENYGLNAWVRLETRSLRAQAFRTNNGTDFFYGSAQVCLDDTPIDNVVPIVVGASLAGLVIIVLVAYLIGRRRQSTGGGYQSV